MTEEEDARPLRLVGKPGHRGKTAKVRPRTIQMHDLLKWLKRHYPKATTSVDGRSVTWRSERPLLRRTSKLPTSRGECPTSRPCPYVSCRHHLLLDVTAKGSLSVLARELEHLPESCSLDVADRGGLESGDVAELLGLTKRRVEQIESGALEKMAGALTLEYGAESFDQEPEADMIESLRQRLRRYYHKRERGHRNMRMREWARLVVEDEDYVDELRTLAELWLGGEV